MANEVKSKFSIPAAITISLAGLPSSTAGVGQQGTLISNSTTGYEYIKIYVKITLGTNPAGSKGVYVWALRGDGTIRTDNAGANDAGITIVSAQPLGMLNTKASPSTGDVLADAFTLRLPGPEWGVAITQDTTVNLNATSTSHSITWVGVLPEIQ
jgi:hypothetical protein